MSTPAKAPEQAREAAVTQEDHEAASRFFNRSKMYRGMDDLSSAFRDHRLASIDEGLRRALEISVQWFGKSSWEAKQFATAIEAEIGKGGR